MYDVSDVSFKVVLFLGSKSQPVPFKKVNGQHALNSEISSMFGGSPRRHLRGADHVGTLAQIIQSWRAEHRVVPDGEDSHGIFSNDSP